MTKSTECTSRFFWNLLASVGSKQAKRSDPAWRTRLNSSKDNFSEKLSFVHKKETEYSFELSFSIRVSYRRIFNLEMQNFSLENHPMMNARQPFLDGWQLLRCQLIRF